ncbi:MAG TPA: 30S ribosomal protein S15 [Candidatus Nanoarchaeia archaeon]|nr:30S ribosomal protein S15 [Candidatus Nanoarchaeia archaeon]
MARRFSRRKGKAGSNKPIHPAIPSWVRYKEKEVELLVTKLAKEGKSPSQIGILLRDIYGIPNSRLILKKSITEMLGEKKLLGEIPEDLLSLIKKRAAIGKHLEMNKKDETAKKGVILVEAKIRNLLRYYKKVGKMPSEWKYDPKRAGMFSE